MWSEDYPRTDDILCCKGKEWVIFRKNFAGLGYATTVAIQKSEIISIICNAIQIRSNADSA